MLAATSGVAVSPDSSALARSSAPFRSISARMSRSISGEIPLAWVGAARLMNTKAKTRAIV
jgi:hypothetical protein